MMTANGIMRSDDSSSNNNNHTDVASTTTHNDVDNNKQRLEDFPYSSCVASNEPTPLVLIREKLPQTLFSNQPSTDDECHQEVSLGENRLQMLVNKILLTTTKLHDKNDLLSLREIQVQIMLRLELYSLVRETFLQQYARFVKTSIRSHLLLLPSLVDKKNDRRRYRHLLKQYKSMSPVQILVEDVRNLLSRAIFQLDASTPFASFCRDCLPRHLFTAIPVIMQGVMDAFEIRNPWEELEKSDDLAISELYLSPIKKKPLTKRRTSLMTSSEQEDDALNSNTIESTLHEDNRHLLTVATMNAKPSGTSPQNGSSDTIHSLVKQPSLATNFTTTIRKRNSLVKDGGKPRLLASHFNAKLSNVSTLFRQVQMTSGAPKQPSLKSLPKQQQQPTQQNGLLRRHNSTSSNVSTTKRKLLAPLARDEPDVTGARKRSKTEKRKGDHGSVQQGGINARCHRNPCPAAAAKTKSQVLQAESPPPRRVVYETPLKSNKQRRASHPLTPLGISNCFVQETPTKNAVKKSTTTTATSPFWDRAKLLAEASQVLRRNQRREDTFW